jgi:hypothetical protein
MKYIQIVTDEWIDILYLNNDKVIRKTNKDSGYYKMNENSIIINWDKWGKEEFIKIFNTYYKCKNNYIEIRLETNEWNDIGIFHINTNKIVRKYFNNESGSFEFNNNDLIINWNNWGIERFYQLNYGKVYTNTNFGQIIKNDIRKEIKFIAIVFPQFHEIPENNEFWGKGFTEWTFLKNIPRIVNGEIIKQPHSDIGYFNLNDYEHRKYMGVLANKFNIYGFCYYHYWFKDKKVMYEPTELMLKDGEPNKPFFFCWANEQWTKKWDGGNNEVLLKQEYSDIHGNIKHFDYLLQFFKHKNYIKKYNKPVFIFYRIEEKDIEEIKNIINLWNIKAVENGFSGIYFMRFLGPFDNSINIDGIEGFIEFQPGYCTQKYYNELCLSDDNKIFNNIDDFDENLYLKKNIDVRENIKNNIIVSAKDHYNSLTDHQKKIRTSKFFIYDGIKLYENILLLKRLHKDQHRGIVTSWNNTPRRNFNNDDYEKYPHYYKNITPKLFGNTVKNLLKKVESDPNENNDDFIFISAWNEWNEQAILEPNNEDGYQNLIELNNAYMEYYNYPTKLNILVLSHIGGGTNKYIEDLKKIFIEYNFIEFDNYESSIDYDEKYKNIDIIHINSILFNNLKDNYIIFLKKFLTNSKKYITIHDYQWLFPEDPNIEKDNFFSEKINYKNILNFIELLDMCNIIIFPSKNIYVNYLYHINIDIFKDKIHIVNHIDKLINYNFLVIPQVNNIINISFIGNFVKYKGSSLFNYLLTNKKTYSDVKIKYHIFGSIDKNENIDYTNDSLILHNSYNDNNIIEILHKNNIHGIMHLSLFEESYCYALTNSINSGIPIFYLNRGSFNERLSNNNKYFSTSIKNIFNNFDNFLKYIIDNQNTYNFYNLNQHLQPNKWYLSNYK